MSERILLPPGRQNCESVFGYPQCDGSAIFGTDRCTCERQQRVPRSRIPESVWAIASDRERRITRGFFVEKPKLPGLGSDSTPLRYDLADEERDQREAEALDRVLSGAPCFDEDLAMLRALRDRLRGGAR